MSHMLTSCGASFIGLSRTRRIKVAAGVACAFILAAGCTSSPQVTPSNTTSTRANGVKISTTTVVDAGVAPSTNGTAPAPSPTAVPITAAGMEGATTTGPVRGGSTVPTVPPVGAPSTTSRPVATVTPTVAPAGVSDTLACIRSYEGSYTSNTGNGHYGAYQFNQSTWDGAVARAGYPEWSGRRASDAPPAIQDAAAAQLLSERGLSPWPTPNRRCQ